MTTDLSKNELAKEHIRFLGSGGGTPLADERFFQVSPLPMSQRLIRVKRVGGPRPVSARKLTDVYR